MRPNGYILWRGKSQINGGRVVCIATGTARGSKNPKTGAFIQTYILPDNGENPVDALHSGADESVCGDCPHRPTVRGGRRKIGSCYVTVMQGPLAVWKAHQRGMYPRFIAREHIRYFRGRLLRIGTYGDPAAVPLKVWDRLTAVATHWTGYTHQWRSCAPAYAKYCMASCETVQDRRLAMAIGYRTFRVRLPEETLDRGEFVCPASAEANKRLTCAECKACSGAKDSAAAVSPCIILHESPIARGYKERIYRNMLAERNDRIALTLV
jgi:hypothetical protein